MPKNWTIKFFEDHCRLVNKKTGEFVNSIKFIDEEDVYAYIDKCAS